MPNKFLPPQTTTIVREASIPLKGEILYDVDENKLYYGDGVTQGGFNLQGEEGPVGNTVWGNITGTLANQTDLQQALSNLSNSGGGASLTDIWLYGGF